MMQAFLCNRKQGSSLYQSSSPQTPPQGRVGTVIVHAISPLLPPEKEIALHHLLEGILVVKQYHGHIGMGMCAHTCVHLVCVCVCVCMCVFVCVCLCV